MLISQALYSFIKKKIICNPNCSLVPNALPYFFEVIILLFIFFSFYSSTIVFSFSPATIDSI